jgi:Ran GTPase-activating protein (RanGAP) involved in mRNA processing and transport
VSKLAAGKWPALARLYFGGPLKGTGAKALAKAKFPALVAFHHNRSAARNDDLKELLKGAWVERLRVLDLDSNQIGDAGVKALAAHPVARELRHLHLGDNSFGKGGLMAVATGFPALTVLDLGSSLKRKATEADAAAFATALNAPVRHLNLHGWPLGDAGAQALAANPALAGLTRLNVDGCKIGDAGVKAILASPHLRNLVELRIDGNDYKPAATNALADPTVLPNLGECWADGSERLRKTVATARPGLYLIV